MAAVRNLSIHRDPLTDETLIAVGLGESFGLKMCTSTGYVYSVNLTDGRISCGFYGQVVEKAAANRKKARRSGDSVDRHKNRCYRHGSKLSALPVHCHPPDADASVACEWRLLAVRARYEGRPLESLRDEAGNGIADTVPAVRATVEEWIETHYPPAARPHPPPPPGPEQQQHHQSSRPDPNPPKWVEKVLKTAAEWKSLLQFMRRTDCSVKIAIRTRGSVTPAETAETTSTSSMRQGEFIKKFV